MKMIKKKKFRFKLKSRVLKKSVIKSSGKKKPKKLLSENRIRNGDRRHPTGLVAGLNQSHDDMGKKIQQQADELKEKTGQLKSGAEKQIRSEEQIYILTKAIESTEDGIFIIYTNQSFRKMTGYVKGEILGQNYFLLYGNYAGHRIVEKIKQTIHKGKSFHGEMLNFRKNGKKYWNLLRIAPVYDARGAVTHYTGIQTDVTLMREKELEIVEQREELLHVTRVGRLAEFVSSLAHEISQPLTAILSYAQAAQRMLAGRDPELREILQYIINDDQRAGEVIQRLRSLLKKSASEMKPLD